METWRKHVSKDTNIMIDIIVNENNTLHSLKIQYKTYSKVFFLTSLLVTIYAIFYFYNAVVDNLLFSLRTFVSNMIHVIIIAIVGTLFITQQSINSKIDKSKKKIDRMRLELIDHLRNTWYVNDYTELREQISDYLERKGINIRYKG